jgi:DNA-binding protein HU-beta
MGLDPLATQGFFRCVLIVRPAATGLSCVIGPDDRPGQEFRRNTVNKAQLTEQLATRFGGNKKAAGHALESVLDTITRMVVAGEKVAITGFGVFEKIERKARTARNPATGATVKVKKTAVPRFKAGSSFKGYVSGAAKLPKLVIQQPPTVAATPAPAAKSAAKKATTTTAKKAAPKKAATKKGTAKKAATKKAGTAAKKSAGTAAKKSAGRAATSRTAAKTATKRTSATKGTTAKATTKRATPTAKRTSAKRTTAKATATRSTARKR